MMLQRLPPAAAAAITTTNIITRSSASSLALSSFNICLCRHASTSAAASSSSSPTSFSPAIEAQRQAQLARTKHLPSTISRPTSLTSTLTLATGSRMPQVGLGTWRSAPGEVGAAVTHALDTGYRAIDGAAVYNNEKEVGAAVNQWLSSHPQVKRSDLFMTSKLWNTNHAPEHVEPALRRTLSDLNTPYLDLYLIHWPVCFLHRLDPKTGQVEFYPKTKKLEPLFTEKDIPIEQTWEALLACKKKGLIRDIGASNFTSEQVIALHKLFGKDGPVVNQVEAHPLCSQRLMQEKLSAIGVHITAYSPLGNVAASAPSAGITPPANAAAAPMSPLHYDEVTSIAKSKGVTSAQLLLRWNLQLGRIVIPKSVRAERIKENAQLFHFDLTDEDMNILNNLNLPPNQHRFLNPTSFKRTPRKYFFTEFE